MIGEPTGARLALLCFCGSTLASADEKAVDFRKDVFLHGRDGYHTYRIPTMVLTSKGTVLLFCEGRKRSWRDRGDMDLLLKRSADGGRDLVAAEADPRGGRGRADSGR